jgi:hypothetical protein
LYADRSHLGRGFGIVSRIGLRRTGAANAAPASSREPIFDADRLTDTDASRLDETAANPPTDQTNLKADRVAS